MKKNSKLLSFLLASVLLFSLAGNAAAVTEPAAQKMQTQEVSVPNDLDADHVYITIQTDDGVAVGRSGDDILEYPIYTKNETLKASDLLFRVHENEFHNINGKKGGNVTDNGSAFTWIWGKAFEDGVSLMEAGKDAPVAPNASLTAGKSYYLNIGSGKTSYIEAKDFHIVTGQSLDFTAKYWDGSSLKNMNGDVYVGKTIADAAKTTTAVDGKFTVDFTSEGKFYVVVKQDGVRDAVCSVIANAKPVSAPYNTFTKADALLQGDLYVVVTKYGGKSYALAYDGGSLMPKEVKEDGDTLVTDDDTVKWYARPNDTFQTYLSENEENKVFVYAGSQGLFTFSTGRKFTYVDGGIKLHDMGFDLTFDGEKFSHTNDPANKGTRCEVTLYSIDLPGNYDAVGFLPDGTAHEPEARTAAKKSASGKYTLAFVSDTHHALDYDELNIKFWIEAVEAENGIEYIDAMGFCGDMGSAYSSTNEIYWNNVGGTADKLGVLNYMDKYQDIGRGAKNGKVGTVIYTFGNHEWYPQAGGDFMHHYGVNETNYSTGEKGDNEVIDRFYRVGKAMETDKYIIYCLGSGGISAQLTSGYSDEDIDSLDKFLASAPTDKPIFILLHFPIHIWGDRLAGNAAKVVETLNKYENKNLIVLWGHNHSDWDENYDSVCRPGSEIFIDQSKTPVKINFTYLSAGCISDAEYSGADGGSAWVQGKGVVVTFDDSWSSTNNNADVKFTYYTMDGKAMEEGGPYLVSFRDGVYYNKLKQVYVQPGESVTPPEAPERVNYTFDKWDTDLSSINRHSLVTANYTYNSSLDKNNVYFTVVDETGKLITGKDGKELLMHPVKCSGSMTVLDAVKALHDAEYAYKDGESAASVYADADHHGALSWVWGYTPNNGAWVFGPGSANGYASATDKVDPGESYYITLYNKTDDTDDDGNVTAKGDYLSTSFLAPYISSIKAGDSLDFVTYYWSFNSSNYKYTQKAFDGKVYVGTSLNELKPAEVTVKDGKFSMSFAENGSYYVVVRDEAETKAIADAVCVVNVGSLPFEDVKSHWAAEGIGYVYEKGLMNGVSGTSFAPNGTLNRAMLVNILYRLAGKPASTAENKFSDVAAGQWYTDAVIWAAEKNIVTGKTATTFAPNDNITREQFATMLMRYCAYAEIDTTAKADLSAFADSDKISSYAKDALAWANAAGIITGKTASTIAPGGNATRGEAATMLMRFLKK